MVSFILGGKKRLNKVLCLFYYKDQSQNGYNWDTSIVVSIAV